MTSLSILIFLAGCTAEAIALEIDSCIALVAQQVFGVATALIGAFTLFALTPLGSRMFNGKMQMISTQVAGTELSNPIAEAADH